MKFFSATCTTFAASIFLFHSIASACNPLTESGCTPNKALGGTVNVDFTQGASSEFTASYNIISYESDGVHLTVAEKGDAPLLVSNWYIMFGRFEIIFKSAPGKGMVSSAILQSDDLDEVDWELLGADPTEAQTNYFGRGVTETYDREVTVADPTATTAFSTYVIDWTEERITWSINGAVLRTLYAADADVDSSGKSEYPQSPMQIKIGPWAGGDPSNPTGTITWAGGEINYAGGPYTMVVQSVSVTDYSTGSAYEYTGTGGTYKDITAIGGAVNGNANGATTGTVSSTPTSTSASSVVTSTATSTIGASSTSAYVSRQSDSTTSINTRTTWPWVPSSTSESSGLVTTTPSTFTVTGSTSSSVETASESSSLSFSLSSSSAAGSAGGSYPSLSAITTAFSTATGVISSTASGLATSTTVKPTSGTSSSTSSAAITLYTGSAVTTTVAKFGAAAACVAAGLALAL